MAFEFGVQPTRKEYETAYASAEELYDLEALMGGSTYDVDVDYYDTLKSQFWSLLDYKVKSTMQYRDEEVALKFLNVWGTSIFPYLKTKDPTQENYWEGWREQVEGYVYIRPTVLTEKIESHGLFAEPFPYPTEPEGSEEAKPFAFTSYEEARRQGQARSLPVEVSNPLLSETLVAGLSKLRASPDEYRYTKLMQLEDIEERDLKSLVKFAEGEGAEQATGISKYLLSEREKGVPV